MDVQYQKCTLQTKAGCCGRPISWSMAAKRTMPLAMVTMNKELLGFLFLCMYVVLFLQL